MDEVNANCAMKSLLREAEAIVCGDRQDAYGLPQDNHGRTAEAWNWYLRHCGGQVDARDVTMLNILQKISRELNERKRDTLVDICGYAANAEACADEL